MKESPRLTKRLRDFNERSERLKKGIDWFFIEDALLYGAIILITLLFDPIYNSLHGLGLVLNERPINIGIGQMVVVGVFGLLLVRKFGQWRSYR